MKRIKIKNNKKEEYNNKDIFTISITSTIFGFVLCLFSLMFITGGKNIITIAIDLKEFVNSYNTLVDNYYEKIDKKKLIQSAIEAMYESVGDKYTTYIDTESSKEFENTINGTYEGIGCTVAMDENNKIYIYNVLENSPSKKAGLKENDIIKKVDGIDYTDKTSTDMSLYIKSNNNPKVTLLIEREEKEIELEIKREIIETPTVSSKIYENNEKKIGYIKISMFSKLTYTQFKKELENLEKDKIDSLIIDVRNNNGGVSDSVINIMNLFLPKDKVIYKEEVSGKIKTIKSTTKELREYDIIVLTNKSSASASEILASSFKESYQAKILGVSTYGKGLVQEVKSTKDGGIIKYTTKKWLTPEGNWVNDVGVKPDYEIIQSEKYYKHPIEENDIQLQEAIKKLSE